MEDNADRLAPYEDSVDLITAIGFRCRLSCMQRQESAAVVITSFSPEELESTKEVVVGSGLQYCNSMKPLWQERNGVTISCGLARPRSLVGEKPTQVAVSHGPGIQPCRCSGNRMLDA